MPSGKPLQEGACALMAGDDVSLSGEKEGREEMEKGNVEGGGKSRMREVERGRE